MNKINSWELGELLDKLEKQWILVKLEDVKQDLSDAIVCWCRWWWWWSCSWGCGQGSGWWGSGYRPGWDLYENAKAA